MTVDPTVIPGFLILVLELSALTAVGFVVVRVALRQSDDRMALAQGLVVGPALWGLIVNFAMYAVPGLAGALVGWAAMLVLGAGLAWRASASIRPRGRVVAGFVVAALALLWVALASRQQLTIPDVENHLGLAASIRSGEFPPELPWVPGVPVPYHYGFDLLVGLLTPPVGPDLAFVTELLGAYIWMTIALIVVTTLIQRGSRMIALALAPLLLTAGAWTLVFATPPHVLQIPVPAGIPSAGLRSSLADTYWPAVHLPWGWPAWASDGASTASPPNIFKPFFVLAYALAFVVLERAAAGMGRRWPRNVVLALLVGFSGLVDEGVAPIVLALWMVLEAAAFWTARPAGVARSRSMLHAAAGPALAALLLAVGGGLLTSALSDVGGSGLSLGWMDDPGSRRPLGAFTEQPGGVGLLGLGPLLVAAIAVLLAWRDRLVLALAAGGIVFLLAALMLQYEFVPRDIGRLDGHARNFALLALLLAVSMRLAGLRPRWRYAAVALVVALIIWPTVVAPARNFGLAVGQGTRLANAQPGKHGRGGLMSRYVIERFPSEQVAGYIRDHTAVDARVFSPSPTVMSVATGRPNASGFAGHVQMRFHLGPEYLDVLGYLEPAAVRQLGIGYVHAPDAWVDGLPEHAVRRLNDPRLFELLVRDGAEALYRVQPEFLGLEVTPNPESFEALRQAVPPSATVYLAPALGTLTDDPRTVLRLAVSLAHAQLLGVVDFSEIHLRGRIPTEPLGGHVPDLVVTSRWFAPWMFPPAARQPIWWRDNIAVFAPGGAVDPIMPPPPRHDPLPFSVRVSDVRAAAGRITFTATFDNRAPERWTGQDWVVIAVDASPWDLPLGFQPDSRTPVAAAWFDGWLGPSAGTTTHTYEFDALASRLAVEDGSGEFTAATGAGRIEGEGAWLLAIRLRHEYRPNYWRDAALIPVLRIMASEAGEVSYQVYADPLAARPLP